MENCIYAGLRTTNRVYAVVKMEGIPIHHPPAHSQFTHPPYTYIQFILLDPTPRPNT